MRCNNQAAESSVRQLFTQRSEFHNFYDTSYFRCYKMLLSTYLES